MTLLTDPGVTGRAPEGGDAGSDPKTEDTTPGEGAAPPPEAGSESPPPQEGAPTRPEYLPEKFWDADKGEPRWEDLAKSYGELERKIGKAKTPEEYEAERLAGRPESADAYEPPEIPDHFDKNEVMSHPMMGWFRQVAHQAGLSQEQFQESVNQYLGEIAPASVRARDEEMKKLGDNATARIEHVSGWVGTKFDEAEAAHLAQIATSAEGVMFIEKLMSLVEGEPLEQVREARAETGDTEETIRQLMASPAYYSPADRDPAVMARVERYFQKIANKKT